MGEPAPVLNFAHAKKPTRVGSSGERTAFALRKALAGTCAPSTLGDSHCASKERHPWPSSRRHSPPGPAPSLPRVLTSDKGLARGSLDHTRYALARDGRLLALEAGAENARGDMGLVLGWAQAAGLIK